MLLAQSKDTSVFSKTCTVCGNAYVVSVPNAQVTAHRSGTLAQNAYPYLSRYQQEFIISGTTPCEWHEIFPED